MSDEPVTSRAEIEQQHAERFQQVVARASLHPHPLRVLHAAAASNAVELSAADVVESGRDLEQVNDDERQRIFSKNYEYALGRLLRQMQVHEWQN